MKAAAALSEFPTDREGGSAALRCPGGLRWNTAGSACGWEACRVGCMMDMSGTASEVEVEGWGEGSDWALLGGGTLLAAGSLRFEAALMGLPAVVAASLPLACSPASLLSVGVGAAWAADVDAGALGVAVAVPFLTVLAAVLGVAAASFLVPAVPGVADGVAATLAGATSVVGAGMDASAATAGLLRASACRWKSHVHK